MKNLFIIPVLLLAFVSCKEKASAPVQNTTLTSAEPTPAVTTQNTNTQTDTMQNQSDEKVYYVKIATSYGDMEVKLYNETPKHRDNFLKLAKEGYYNDLLFHRVMNAFMIQGGDPDSKNAAPGQRLGSGGPGYTIPAEFRSGLIHKKGALAAARQGDGANPEKRSSGSQFYIVQGKKYMNDELTSIERSYGISLTEDQKKIYRETGGTPFLDYNYTVFGEVVSGLDVIDKIAAVKTDGNDRPVQDIRMRISVIEK